MSNKQHKANRSSQSVVRHNDGGVNGQPYYPQGRVAQAPQASYAQSPYQQGGPVRQPQKNPSGPAQSKDKRPMSFYVAIVIAVLAAIACAALAFSFLSQPQTGNRDLNSLEGQLEGKTAEEVQAALDQYVEEGMFNISIASYVEFPTPEGEGEIKIENVPGNRYLMQVDVVRDDTGETIYSSGILDPNHHIQKAPLDVRLEPGYYECTAVFHALDPETEEQIGQAAAKIGIAVGGDS